MDFRTILLCVVCMIIGGVITSLLGDLRQSSGVLKIDHSNPEKDIYRFEIDDLDKLNKKKHVVLKVDHNADLSQK